MKKPGKACLIVLDGWGHGPDSITQNAVKKAKTPFVDSLYKNHPNGELLTCGEHVGLPKGQMGNSEVGHLNLGAGRVVYQPLVRINRAFQHGEVDSNASLLEACRYAKDKGCNVHFIGLLSDGGVHSHIEHWKHLVTFFTKHGITNLKMHAFTDGRDTDPKSSTSYLSDLEAHLKEQSGEMASIVGRFYAMDRDKRWERIKEAYDLLVKGIGKEVNRIDDGVAQQYAEGETDEFLSPLKLPGYAPILAGDVVVNLNFRTDRGRQLSIALTQQDLSDEGMATVPIHYVTLTEYDPTYKDVAVVFENQNPTNTLGEVISTAGLRQLRMAETEKYPHVTFFFSGGREEPFPGEERLMMQSPKVKTYDLQPEMSAFEITQQLIPILQRAEHDLVVLNFANPDMVGHTGVFNAVVKAVETTDSCCEAVSNTALSSGYKCFITADHGNADFAQNNDGSPNTAHTLNPVPYFVLGQEGLSDRLPKGRLADVAPTLLKMMGMDAPEEMNGTPLF